jgi:hypothetical protein
LSPMAHVPPVIPLLGFISCVIDGAQINLCDKDIENMSQKIIGLSNRPSNSILFFSYRQEFGE